MYTLDRVFNTIANQEWDVILTEEFIGYLDEITIYTTSGGYCYLLKVSRNRSSAIETLSSYVSNLQYVAIKFTIHGVFTKVVFRSLPFEGCEVVNKPFNFLANFTDVKAFYLTSLEGKYLMYRGNGNMCFFVDGKKDMVEPLSLDIALSKLYHLVCKVAEGSLSEARVSVVDTSGTVYCMEQKNDAVVDILGLIF